MIINLYNIFIKTMEKEVNFDYLKNQIVKLNNLIPIPNMNNDSFIMINSKQAQRIIKRRLEKIEKNKENLKYFRRKDEKIKSSSRHYHACRRQRNRIGRFVSKDEGEGEGDR